jgi:hypothetical protein
MRFALLKEENLHDGESRREARFDDASGGVAPR